MEIFERVGEDLRFRFPEWLAAFLRDVPLASKDPETAGQPHPVGGWRKRQPP